MKVMMMTLKLLLCIHLYGAQKEVYFSSSKVNVEKILIVNSYVILYF